MTVRIAVVGDRVDLPALHQLEGERGRSGADVESRLLPPGSLRVDDLGRYDALWLAQGPPSADDEAVVDAVQWAREQGVPLLGTDGALRYAVLDLRRAVTRMPATRLEPGSTEGGGDDGTLLQRHGWVLDATAPGAGVLALPGHPFFVLLRSEPGLGTLPNSDQGTGALAGRELHPVVTAFVAAAQRRAQHREAWEARQADAAALTASEARPRPYVHQMRGPRHRWWRPLLAGLVAVTTWLLLTSAVTALFAAAGLVPDTLEELGTDPWGSLYGNLVLIALVPATLLGLWVGHRRSPARVLSVTGRFRWRWALRCLAVVTPLWVAYLVLTWVVFDQEVLPRSEQWVGLVVVSLLTTPLQAAAEEIAFRGGLVQSVGSWFRSPVVALVVTTVLSTAAFVAAHGSADPWIVVEIGSLAVAGCYLAWRTGGLEAVIVIHVVNNLLITLSGALLGGLEESYVDTETTGSPVSALMSVVVTALAAALLLRVARRRGIAPSGWLSPARG